MPKFQFSYVLYTHVEKIEVRCIYRLRIFSTILHINKLLLYKYVVDNAYK